MTPTPILDDLTTGGDDEVSPPGRTAGGGILVAAGRRPSPVRRATPHRRVVPSEPTAFGQGCLDEARPADTQLPGSRPTDGELPRLVDAARREVEALGHGRVGTEHLLLAVVRSGGEVGRAFGLRRAGSAVVAAACVGAEPLVAPDGTPALTAAAAAALARARSRATTRKRPAAAADLALALLDAGRSTRLLADLGVDREDLADVLAREDLVLPDIASVRADVRPEVPAPTPVGTLPPVALMLPGPSPARAGAATAPLRIGPPAGSPARRSARWRAEALARHQGGAALDLPA